MCERTADDVKELAGALSAEAENLDGEVRRFLDEVRSLHPGDEGYQVLLFAAELELPGTVAILVAVCR